MLNSIPIISSWKKSLLIISLVPILFLGFSFISYGFVFNPFFDKSNSFTTFFKLTNQFSLFKSDIGLPIVLKLIGRISIVTLYGLFISWVVLFTVSSYMKLSLQVANKVELILELALVSILYFFIVSPASILFYLLGLLVIVINLGLIVLYWIYALKAKR